MNNVIELRTIKHEARVDTRILAERLQNQHESVMRLVDDYKADFESIGVVRFEIEKPKKSTKGGRPERYALLSEDQCYLLLAFSRNTPHVRKLKLELVKAFSRFRKHEQNEADYLPYYHELHDSVKAFADLARRNGSATDEGKFHINFNRLINSAFGLECGQRQALPGHLRIKLTAANIIAKELIEDAIAKGLDHKAAFQHVKQGLQAFANAGAKRLGAA